jgi:ADP-heptose:LPS heptosyltransferase
MKLLKRLESLNRKAMYGLIKLFLRNLDSEIPVNQNKIKKILILRYDAIGDMIVTTPIFEIIKKNIPDVELHILASHRNYSIIANEPLLDKTQIFDGSFKSFFKSVRTLRKEKYELIFSLVLAKTTLSGVLANMIGGRRAIKVTLRHEARANLYSAFFNVQIPSNELRSRFSMAEIQSMIVCRTFGWNYDKSIVNLRILLNDSNLEYAEKFLSSIVSGYKLLLNISSGNNFRKLNIENNIKLINSITRTSNIEHRTSLNESTNQPINNFQIIILAVSSDFDDAKKIANEFTENVHIFPSTNSILDSAALISKCDFVVTPDTSIVHVSAVFKKPTIVMFSLLASFIEEWIPFGTPYRSISTKGRDPLDTISIEEVAKAINELMNEPSS